MISLLFSDAIALDELDALTDETIQSACHGYVLFDWAQTVAHWLGTDSPLCRRVREGTPPRVAIDQLRERGRLPPRVDVQQDYTRQVDTLAIECNHDFMCTRERRRAQTMGHPLDMLTYLRVRELCNSVYGCIEQRLMDWPRLEWPQASASLPGFIPFTRTMVTIRAVSLRSTPGGQSVEMVRLREESPVSTLERDRTGQWLRVRVVSLGLEGYLPATALASAENVPDSADAARDDRLVPGRSRSADPLVAALQGRAPSATAGVVHLDSLVRSGVVQRQHASNEEKRAFERAHQEAGSREAERQRLVQEREAKMVRDRERQVQLQRRQQQAQREDRSGMAFLGGLAAAGLGVARGLDGNAAGRLGVAVARDIESGSVRNTQSISGSAPAGNGASRGTGGGAAQANYQSESVQIRCPSGVVSNVPLKFLTQTCRNAMVDFAQVFTCNDANQMQRVQQQCQQSCGNSSCLQ